MGTVRRDIHVRCSPEDAWTLVGNPARVHEWFPMHSSRVEGTKRWVTLPSLLTLEEDILTVDSARRRFQYSIVPNALIKDHLSTVDVIEEGTNQCKISYTVEVTPDVFALVIAGAAGEALENARRILESGQ